MPSWSEFEAAAPDLATEVRRRLEAHRHKTIATLRRDGSPRISGTETEFRDGELWIGSMWQALKAHDLQRDPRFALHSGSSDPPDDPPDWPGDAKVAGVAEEITDPGRGHQVDGPETPPEPSHLFRLDVREASTVSVSGDELLIEMWTADGGTRTIRRK